MQCIGGGAPRTVQSAATMLWRCCRDALPFTAATMAEPYNVKYSTVTFRNRLRASARCNSTSHRVSFYQLGKPGETRPPGKTRNAPLHDQK